MFARGRVSRALFCLASLLFIVSDMAGACESGAPQQARITGMKVSTVEPTLEGKFSELNDIFDYGLRNEGVPFAGSGSANYPVHNLLVMVEVTGQGWQYKVELQAAEGRRLVYRKVAMTNVPSGGGETPAKSYAFFMLDGDRCERLKLTAILIDERGRKASRMTKLIDFACGE